MFRNLLFVLLMGFGLVSAQAGDNAVKAKIGIMRKSGDMLEKLKAKDHAKSGEQVRIFVQPQQASYVYVIDADEKEVTLLNSQKNKKHI